MYVKKNLCTHVHDVVVKDEPESARLDDGDVVSAVGSRPAVDDHGHQVVHPVGVDGVVGGVEEPELEREDHPVGDLDVPVDLVHVLEPLQVEGQDGGQPLHAHPLLQKKKMKGGQSDSHIEVL